MALQLALPVVVAREERWFVASCPVLDIATQGRTEKEAKENIASLIDEYLRDPDTRKPTLDDLMSLSLSNVRVTVPEGVLSGKNPTSSETQSS